MRTILGIDPGTTESAYILWDGTVKEKGFLPNAEILFMLRMLHNEGTWRPNGIAIEMIASMGMAVGQETFDTCLWIGRFIERAHIKPRLVYRKEIKMHFCGTPRAKDTNVRQSLIDRHGAPGTKNNPGTLYGVSKHIWSALAVADYALSNPQ